MADPPFHLISIDIENAPKPTRSSEVSKKKEKVAKAEVVATPVKYEDATTPTGPAATKEIRKEKDKKESKQKKSEAAGTVDIGKSTIKRGDTPVTNESTVPVPSMIDLRVGHIIDGIAALPSRFYGNSLSFQLKDILTQTDYTLR